MAAPAKLAASREGRFAKNVAWNWLGVIVALVAGFVVSPYVIHKIGDEGYGVWTLVFSLIEYYWLLDLGFRSATVKYSAHYRATGELDKLNELINTGLVYYSFVGIVVLGATLLLSRYAVRFFNISGAFQRIFPTLVMIVGVSYALGTACSVFSACLEGFQRFDALSRIWILGDALRSAGILILLWRGYGLVALGVMVVASQVFGYVLSYVSFRRTLPAQRFSFSSAKLRTFRQMAAYGVHTFVATIAGRGLNETVPVLIGHFLSATATGYYMLPMRLLQYSAQAVSGVGIVTGSTTAELAATGDLDEVAKLGVYVNRYCLVLFAPIALIFLVYGHELLQVWIGRDFAANSSALLPVLTIATALAVAGQFNSTSILYGLGKHAPYARGLMAEAIVSFAASLIVIPRYGILGAAWLTSVLMILNRTLWTGWVVSRSLGLRVADYMRSIYVRPAVTAVPVFVLLYLLKQTALPVRNWPELIAACAISASTYLVLAWWICLDREHRVLAVSAMAARFRPRTAREQ